MNRFSVSTFRFLAIIVVFCSIGNYKIAFAAASCSAGSITGLKDCMANIDSYSEIVLTSNITCSNNSDCCTEGGPLMNFNFKTNKTIRSAVGNYIINRTAGQKQCHVLSGVGAENITVSHVIFDEDSSTPPCSVSEYIAGCKETIYWNTASNVLMDNVKVLSGKSYAVLVWGGDGFTLSNSEVNDSGIIGLYLGHIDFAPTRNVTITNNKFLRARTNAIAIEGVVGDVGGGYSNNISWNTISENHWDGQFLVDGTISGGGQVLLGAGDHISFDNNTITDGFCSSCWANFVPGVEIGFASRAYTLSDTSISNNKIYNNNGDPIVVTTWDGSRTDSSVKVTGNFMINNETPFGSLRVDGAFQSGNTLKDYIKQIGWESQDDFPAGWNSWQTCSDGGQLVRWNAGSAAMHGTFALRMVSGEMAPCGGEGLWMQGINTPISPGDTVYVSSWVRNGGWKGALCIVVADTSFTEIASTCRSFSPDAWTYNANPLVSFKMPASAKYFQVKIGLQSANAYADLDNLRLTW